MDGWIVVQAKKNSRANLETTLSVDGWIVVQAKKNSRANLETTLSMNPYGNLDSYLQAATSEIPKGKGLDAVYYYLDASRCGLR